MSGIESSFKIFHSIQSFSLFWINDWSKRFLGSYVRTERLGLSELQGKVVSQGSHCETEISLSHGKCFKKIFNALNAKMGDSSPPETA